MKKWDFNKVAKQLYWNCTSAWVFSCKFAAYSQNTFSSEHLWRAASIWFFSDFNKLLVSKRNSDCKRVCYLACLSKCTGYNRCIRFWQIKN